MPLETGRRVGDYEILDLLGAGGMGQVYRVRNVVSERIEAMKVLLPDLAAESALAERFLAEIRMLASFDHPNIAQLRTAFQADNQLLMVMEFVEGETLDARLQRGDLPLAEGLGYIEQVLDALAYAHTRGVIHRDVKPANIMVTPSGSAKLLDFGIAKQLAGEKTQAGATLGSVLYMSPEQVKGQAVDARSDLYAVGVVLYQLATSRRPFEADNVYRLMEMHMSETPVPPIQLKPDIPPALSQIVVMALAKDPQGRFQRAEAMRNALESVRNTLMPAAAPRKPTPLPATIATQPRKSNHRGLWVTVGALAVVAILGAGATLLPYWSRTHAETKVESKQGNPTPAAPPLASTPQQAAEKLEPAVTATTQPGPLQKPVARTPVVKHETIYDVLPAKPAQTAAANVPAPVASSVEPPVKAAESSPQSNEDIEKAKDRMIQLGTRAAAVKDSVERLRAEQAASGLGLRQDISAAANRMAAYMDEADRALNAGDFKLAEKRADQAEKEIKTLEEFMGR